MDKPRLAWLTALMPVAAICGSLLTFSTPGKAVDRFLYDALFMARGDLRPPENIALVVVDEPSFGVIRKAWPWPRGLHARLVESLNAAGARVVAMDILFAEPSNPDDDGSLKHALSKAPVALAASLFDVTREKAYTQTMIVNPAQEVAGPSTKTGFVNLPVDPDGFVRRAFIRQGGIESFDLSAAISLTGKEPALPAGADSFLINYRGPARTIRTVSYYQALEPETHLPKGFFKDKLVIVGVAFGLSGDSPARQADHYPTPHTRFKSGYSPGPEIHANAIASLAQGDWIAELPWAATSASGLFVALLCGIAFHRMTVLRGTVLFCGMTLAVTAASYVSFARWNLSLPIAQMAFPLVAVYMTGYAHHYSSLWREKRLIKKTFATYLAPSVVEKLLRDPAQIRLGGSQVEGTVLFADLAGFTTLSGRVTPEKLMEMMNGYLSVATEIILRNGGMVDKFIGDAVMAVWGAPEKRNDHAALACVAALEMKRALSRLGEEEEKRSGHRLSVRIGVNSGSMIAGNVGGERYHNFTVLGDQVNLASRLEGINKFYGTSAIIGAATAAGSPQGLVLRRLDVVQVKGAERGLEIFELFGDESTVTKEERAMLAAYASGLELYRNRKWRDAANMFVTALDISPDDGPSLVMKGRCAAFIANPPPPGWDGVTKMTEK